MISQIGKARIAPFLFAVITAILLVSSASETRAQVPRRIGVGLMFGYYFFDSEYFGLDNGPGIDLVFRYEISQNIFFENRFGYLSPSNAEGVKVKGIDLQLAVYGVFPVLIPYRPYARGGIAFMSANPITVTPTETFRPSQTTFYFIFGGGFTRSLKENFMLEAGANLWIAPYYYRIYTFDRNRVRTADAQFTHVSFTLSCSYIF